MLINQSILINQLILFTQSINVNRSSMLINQSILFTQSINVNRSSMLINQSMLINNQSINQSVNVYQIFKADQSTTAALKVGQKIFSAREFHFESNRKDIFTQMRLRFISIDPTIMAPRLCLIKTSDTKCR